MSTHCLILPFRASLTALRKKAVVRSLFVGILLCVVLCTWLQSHFTLRWTDNESLVRSLHGKISSNCCTVPSSDCPHRIKHRPQREIPLKIVGLGENIKVGETTEVHVMSAIRRGDYPVPGWLNVILLTWAGNQKEDNRSFACCLTTSSRSNHFVQVPAKLLFTDPKNVDMKLHLFSCSLTDASDNAMTQNANNTVTSPEELRYVAFAEQSCDVSTMTTTAHELAEPPNGGNKYAVCVGFAYGQLDPVKLVEWFEFSRLVGVSVVQVFYHIVSEEAMKVFRYYEKIGFLILSPVTPAARRGHPPRGFLRSLELHNWADKTVLANTCMHLLSKYDFVGVQDFDELFVPSPPFNTLLEVLQDARARNPQVAVFTANTYIVLTDWPESDPAAPIYFLRRLERTVNDTLDNAGVGKSSPKIVFRPLHVLAVATHRAIGINSGYSSKPLDTSNHQLLHYRSCKTDAWKGCKMERVRDENLLRFQTRWVRALSELPLLQLGCGQQYTNSIADRAKTLDQSAVVEQRVETGH